MRYFIRLTSAVFALLFLTTAAQAQDEGDAKFWKKKAKMYAKNPEALQAEFQNYQDQISDLKRRNKELMNQVANTQSSDAIDSLRWALIEANTEVEQLRGQNEKLKRSYGSQKAANDQGIRAGLVYRVQIIASVFNEMQMPGAVSDDFLVERADGFNKFVIGGYRTYDEAVEFRDKLRELGFADAWVVPYIDGKRASINEANEYLSNRPSQASFLD
ncbi:MAG: hypothetical protein OHK0039_43840 [Bacteroidia bacterium]